MKLSKIKAFIPFELETAGLYEWCGIAAKSKRTAEVIAHFIAKDPAATAWSSMGLTEPVEEGAFVHDLDGTARMLMYQFNDRMLPAAVRDEKLGQRYTEFGEKEGRPPNKKEFAQMREDVETDLLPRAFIKRTTIPVMVFKDVVLVCTSSATKAEKVMSHLGSLAAVRKIKCELKVDPAFLEIDTLLMNVARIGTVSDVDEESDFALSAGSSVVFKGEDKRAVRIKDREVMSEEVQTLSNSGGYRVVELGVALDDVDAGHEVGVFTLNSQFVFKGIKLSNVTLAGIGHDKADVHATYWLYAKTLHVIYSFVVSVLRDTAAAPATGLSEALIHDDSDDL
jgi:recombination associated protein RdgC